MKDQNNLLIKCKSTANQTLEMGNDIMQRMDINNKTIQSSNQKTQQITDELGFSNSIIGRMIRREMMNKIILTGIVSIIVIAILIIIYLKFAK